MNIVFDLDGTLANLDHRLRYIRLMVGSAITYNDQKFRVMAMETTETTVVTLGFAEDHNDTVVMPLASAQAAFKPNWDAFFDAVIDDNPIEEMVAVFNALRISGHHKLIIATGRSDVAEHDTMFWLEERGINAGLVLFRRAGDHRPDVKVKFDMYTTLLAKDMKPDLVFEDRQGVVDMWRSHGIRVAQVAPGNF